jgi:glycosyltransferase involved in cell wall biosynthesis
MAKRVLRERLGLPLDRPIVLSVGWIARQHKRMHYVIEEVARMPEPRPFVQLLGAMDDASPEIVELGNRLLGPANFSARSVRYEQVADYYAAADCFVLASLQEGFGRVYLEALMHGLPTIGHQHPVIEYVLGDVGITADLSQPGNLAPLLTQILKDSALRAPHSALATNRWESVRTRFCWPVLAPKYREMFHAVASCPTTWTVKQ